MLIRMGFHLNKESTKVRKEKKYKESTNAMHQRGYHIRGAHLSVEAFHFGRYVVDSGNEEVGDGG